jgi:hypothetical protein
MGDNPLWRNFMSLKLPGNIHGILSSNQKAIIEAANEAVKSMEMPPKNFMVYEEKSAKVIKEKDEKVKELKDLPESLKVYMDSSMKAMEDLNEEFADAIEEMRQVEKRNGELFDKKREVEITPIPKSAISNLECTGLQYELLCLFAK